MSSFMAQIMEPGGGVLLLPVRFLVLSYARGASCLLSHTAREHMLLVSQSFHTHTRSSSPLQFVKIVVSLLLLTTLTIFVAGIARIHMAILSFLSAGLLLSLTVFEKEYKKLQASREDEPSATPVSNSDSKEEKTD